MLMSSLLFLVTIVAHGVVKLFKSRPAHGGKPASSFDETKHTSPKWRIYCQLTSTGWKNVRIIGLAVLLMDRKIGGVPVIRIYDIGVSFLQPHRA